MKIFDFLILSLIRRRLWYNFKLKTSYVFNETERTMNSQKNDLGNIDYLLPSEVEVKKKDIE